MFTKMGITVICTLLLTLLSLFIICSVYHGYDNCELFCIILYMLTLMRPLIVIFFFH